MPKNKLPFELFKRKLVFVVIAPVDVVTPVTSSPPKASKFECDLTVPFANIENLSAAFVVS